MTAVQANDITLEYEEDGSGEPLLLIMGLGGQLVDWPVGLVGELVERGFRVIRFDNRDIGLSTAFDEVPPPTRGQLARSITIRRPMPSGYVLSDMAADAVGLLDALGIDRAHVAGMSMGGMIAQQMAIDHADRVSSLVSIMSTTEHRKVRRPAPKVARMALRRQAADEYSIDDAVDFFRAISGPGFDEAEFRELAERDFERSFRPDGTARQLAAIIASGDRTPALQELDVPTLVIHGLVDTLVKPSGGIATAEAIPGSRLLMFNDMGHDLPTARHAEIAEAVVRNAERAGAALGMAVVS